ncbi:GNAT family N-acetyltransferase [Agromyces sp. SYSU T0242]|uniref:GNAT family N-acetyltransferase n=1 Tax=Agromyces litoreus TaxID=3158561 RepID=UPI0033908180
MTRPDLVIRSIREADWREVRALRLEMLRDTPIAFGDTYERASRFGEAEWRARARRGQSPVQAALVAIEGDRWVGTMGCYVPDAATGPMLVGVYVAPDRRGDAAGVTSALLAGIERWAADRAGTLTLEVHEDNARARRFYERMGFEYTGHRRPYELEPGGLELEMRKHLR